MVSKNGTTIIDVTGNDTDDSDDSDVVISMQTQPTSGTVSIDVDEDLPVVEYTPDSGAPATDSFTYEACVDGSCDTATVTIFIGTSGCTIKGTNGADTLTGTEGDDVICGRKGHDTINGLGGNDIIFGGKGRDTIDGGDGDDVIRGQRGKDTISGGAGDDEIRGGRFQDILDGGPGNDRIYGGDGDDILNGGDGDDLLIGKAGADLLNGGEGNDVLRGWRGPDVLNGDGGNDYLYGGRGQDVLDGGDGDDVLYGRQHADTLSGGAGDDELRGNRGPDTLDGGPGTDLLRGGHGNDSADGGEGTDDCEGETITNCEDDTVVTPTLAISYPIEGGQVFDQLQLAVTVTDPPEAGELVVLVNETILGTFGRDQASLAVDLAAIAAGSAVVVVQVRSGEEILVSTSVSIELDHLDAATGFDDLEDLFDAGQITVDEYLVNGIAALATASEEGTSPTLSEEFTTDVLSLALETWGEASAGAKQATIEMATPELVPDPGAGLRAAAATCEMSGPYVWALAGIRASNFCEYKVDPSVVPADLIPAGVSRTTLTEIDFLVDPALDGTTVGTDGILSLGNSAIPFPLAQAAKRMWEAEALFEGMGLSLPESHREEGVPIHVFIVDNDLAAFSSPFNEKSLGNGAGWLLGQREFGHPIRVRTAHLSKTIIHEFFHTFEWDTINWTNDVALGSETGRTVVLYESAANWGTHEFSRQGDRDWAYNFGRSMKEWLVRPQQQFMQSPSGPPDVIKAPDRAYAYFPAMVWLNEHAGQHGPTNQLMPSVIRALDSHAFGADPIDLIEDQVDGGLWANPGGEPMARAWPRMWTALYLMSDDSTNTAPVFGTPEYSWSKLPNSEVARWGELLDGSSLEPLQGEAEFSEQNRLGRYPDSPIVLSAANPSFLPIPRPSVAKGGAGFVDVKVDVAAGSEGYSRVTVDSVQAGRNTKFEVAVTQYGSAGYPNVCLRAGVPQFFLSDGVRNAAGEVVIDVPFDDNCSDFTVALVHVDPNSGRGDFLSLQIELHDEGGITTTDVPDGEAGKPYDPFAFASVDPSAVWSVTAGTVPEGLRVNTAGILNGKPTEAGPFSFTLQASAPGGPSPTRDFNMDVVGPRVTTNTLPGGQVGVGYSQTVQANAYYPDFGPTHPGRPAISSYELDAGSLPDGLALDTVSGLISGQPTSNGDYEFTIAVSDTAGNTGSRTYTVSIGAPSRAYLQFRAVTTPDPLIPGQAGTGVITVTNTGGETATGRTLRFRLPDGFSSISAPGCGLVAGQTTVFDCPLVDIAPGDVVELDVSFMVPAGFDPTSRVFRFGDLKPVFADTGYIIAYLNQGWSYSHQIVATDPDGDDADLVFSIVAGSLPPGFGMDSSGLIAGVMQVTEDDYIWDFTVRVVDATGAEETAELRLWINQSL